MLGVAAFLATSWTWCIGMFLPVLLLRDLGLWSFLVFAIPNCVGAALMGWVMRRPGSSERFIAAHRRACIWFSLITIGFHAFFLMWITQIQGLPVALVGGFLVNIGINLLTTWRRWSGWMPAVLTYGVSLACAAMIAYLGHLGGDAPGPGVLPGAQVLWLAPVCVFGFLFCPYLDLSFHLARQTLPGPAGTRAFVAGFGGLFLGMILFTLAYAGMFLRTNPALSLSDPGLMVRSLGLGAVSALLLHMSAQAAFTIHLHIGMVSRTLHGVAWKPDWLTGMALLLPTVLGVFSSWLPSVGGTFGGPGMSGGEAIYRAFMAFYGLVFPAYIWICALPGWNTRPTRPQILMFAGAVGVAVPMFYMGFIERQTWWLAPGLGVVLAARFASPVRQN